MQNAKQARGPAPMPTSAASTPRRAHRIGVGPMTHQQRSRMGSPTRFCIGAMWSIAAAVLLVDVTLSMTDGTDGTDLTRFALSVHGTARLLVLIFVIVGLALWIVQEIRLAADRVADQIIERNGAGVVQHPVAQHSRLYAARSASVIVDQTVGLPTVSAMAAPLLPPMRPPSPMALPQPEQRRRGGRGRGRRNDDRASDEEPGAGVAKQFGIYLAARDELRREQNDLD